MENRKPFLHELRSPAVCGSIHGNPVSPPVHRRRNRNRSWYFRKNIRRIHIGYARRKVPDAPAQKQRRAMPVKSHPAVFPAAPSTARDAPSELRTMWKSRSCDSTPTDAPRNRDKSRNRSPLQAARISLPRQPDNCRQPGARRRRQDYSRIFQG